MREVSHANRRSIKRRDASELTTNVNGKRRREIVELLRLSRPHPMLVMAESQLQAGQFEKALKSAQDVLAHTPQDHVAAFVKSICLIQLERATDALCVAVDRFSRVPRFLRPTWAFVAAFANATLGDDAEAAKWTRQIDSDATELWNTVFSDSRFKGALQILLGAEMAAADDPPLSVS